MTISQAMSQSSSHMRRCRWSITVSGAVISQCVDLRGRNVHQVITDPPP